MPSSSDDDPSPQTPRTRRIRYGWRLWEKPWPVRVLATTATMTIAFVAAYALLSRRGRWDNAFILAALFAVLVGLANGLDSLGITWQRPGEAATEARRRWATRFRVVMAASTVAFLVALLTQSRLG